MIYEVTLKHYFESGSRESKYRICLDEDEFEQSFGNDEFDLNPDLLAVEFAINKFFKNYILTEGCKLEVLSAKRVS